MLGQFLLIIILLRWGFALRHGLLTVVRSLCHTLLIHQHRSKTLLRLRLGVNVVLFTRLLDDLLERNHLRVNTTFRFYQTFRIGLLKPRFKFLGSVECIAGVLNRCFLTPLRLAQATRQFINALLYLVAVLIQLVFFRRGTRNGFY